MKRRGLPLVLSVLVVAILTIPGIALAGSDNGTGNACPPPTPQSTNSPPPGCGTDNGTNGTNGGTNGTNGGTNGTNGGTNGSTTNACPPNSPAGTDTSPPPGCGHTTSGTSTSGTSTSGTSTSGTSTSGTSTSGTSTSGTSTSGTSTSGTSTSGTSTSGTSTSGTSTSTTTTSGADPCTAAAGDPGITGNGTIAQQLYDGGLSALPIVQDPDADGPLSSQIYAGGNGTQLEPLTDEVACLVNLPVLDL